MDRDAYIQGHPKLDGPLTLRAPLGGLAGSSVSVLFVSLWILHLSRSNQAEENFIYNALSFALLFPAILWILATLFHLGLYGFRSYTYKRKFTKGRGPIWTLDYKEFKNLELLEKSLTEDELKVAQQFMKEGFQGSVNELITLAKELT